MNLNLNTLTYLAICIIACLIAGKIVKQIKLPNVTGYLIIGIIIGPCCLKLIPAEVVSHFDIISEMALGFIAFSIGGEFKLSYLKKIGKAPIVIAIFESFMAVFAVDAALIATGHSVPFSLCLGAIAAATAPAATLMVIRQYKADGPVTKTLLPVVAIDDATALMAFGISVAVAKALTAGSETNFLLTMLDPLYEIGGAIVFGGILGVILAFLPKFYHSRGNRLSAAIAFVFLCEGICDIAGFSSLLACMVMSAAFVNLSNEADKVFEQVDRVTPPLFMLFFMISGADLNIYIIPTVGVVGIIYIIFRMIGKILGSSIGSRISHTEPVVQKWLGFTLIPQAGVAIGLSSIAMQVVPAYGEQIRAVILCGTVIYELIGPVITKTALTKAGEIKAA
ncbi:MAG: cation:proton antiporter [Lachnospiraceae bacterium]|nr:cation:proton antiporter [Lachnospiraceae bacterium]